MTLIVLRCPTTVLQFRPEQMRLFEERRDRNGSECRPPRSGKRTREEDGAERTGNRKDDVKGDVPTLTEDCLHTFKKDQRKGHPAVR